MRHATSVYILTLCIFGSGLWLILSIGSVFLHAPTDLSGPWQLYADKNDPEPEAEMTMKQSGRFCLLEFGKASYSMKLKQDLHDDRGLVTVVFTGANDLEVRFSGNARGKELALTVTGPIQGEWIASRLPRPRLSPTTAHAQS